MFFKKKITVENFCSDYLKTLFLPDIDLVYEQLRDECADPALSAVDHNLYFDHIRAVIIELMEIAITKNCRWPINTDDAVFIAEYLEERGLSYIDSLSPDSLTSIYSSAFGTIGYDGVACMVAAFSEAATDSQMRPETISASHLPNNSIRAVQPFNRFPSQLQEIDCKMPSNYS